MAKIINNGKFVARDSNGDPLAGGKLYSYVSGSGGATQKATYTTSALTVANTNPVILDGDGRADVWTAGGSYLLVLKDSADNTIWTVDDYNDGTNEDVNSAYDTYGIFTVTVEGTTTINVNTVLGVDYELGVNALRVYVNGVHQELADGAFAEVTGGQTIEMAEGLNVGDVVGIYLRSTVASTITQAPLVTYIPPDVGDIQTNVRDALRALDVTNIAELKAIDGSYASKAIVNGYYTDGDGGGGEFYWDPTSSATADDGITIQPTSVTGNGRWIRVYSGAVNVKWFGAKGDGTSDDTNAIQKVIDMSTTVSIFIPTGTYKVTSCLNFTNGFKKLYGENGNAIASKIHSSSSNYIIDTSGSNWATIKDLELFSTTAKIGIYSNRTTDANGAYTQYNEYSNLRVFMGTDALAEPTVTRGFYNENVGRIGFYGRSNELNLITNCQFIADTPLYLISVKGSTGSGDSLAPIYDTEGIIDSMTCTQFINCIFFSKSTSLASVRLYNVGNINFYGCYIGSFNLNNSVNEVPAIFTDVNDYSSLQFQIETYSQGLEVSSFMQSCKIYLYMELPSTLGTILLDNNNTSLISFIDNDVHIKTGGGLSTSNYLIGVPNQSTANIYIESNILKTSGGIGGSIDSANPVTGNSINIITKTNELTIGNIKFDGQSVYPSGSGGVNFSSIGTGSSGTSTSRILDQYDSGTFTPSIKDDSAGVYTITYTTRTGIYTRIGNVVFISIILKINTVSTSGGAGVVIVDGLPFTVSSLSTLSVSQTSNWTANQPSEATAGIGDDFIYLLYKSTANGDSTFLPYTDINNGAEVVISGSYFA